MVVLNAINSVADMIANTFYGAVSSSASYCPPYSNGLMHVAGPGAFVFLLGKGTAKATAYIVEEKSKNIPLIGKSVSKGVKFAGNHSNVFGFLAAGLAELVWLGVVEPNSPYDIDTTASDIIGVAETVLGATLAYGATNIEKPKEIYCAVKDKILFRN